MNLSSSESLPRSPTSAFCRGVTRPCLAARVPGKEAVSAGVLPPEQSQGSVIEEDVGNGCWVGN